MTIISIAISNLTYNYICVVKYYYIQYYFYAKIIRKSCIYFVKLCLISLYVLSYFIIKCIESGVTIGNLIAMYISWLYWIGRNERAVNRR